MLFSLHNAILVVNANFSKRLNSGGQMASYLRRKFVVGFILTMNILRFQKLTDFCITLYILDNPGHSMDVFLYRILQLLTALKFEYSIYGRLL